MKKIIKRYRNRKLYDTSDSSYVTLEDIADIIKQGHDVQIIDNATGEDITGQTLAQIIFEEEKKKQSRLPLEMLRSIIQTGGEAIKGLLQKDLSGVKNFVEEKLKPTIEGVQNIPTLREELRNLRSKIEQIEKKVRK